jgi:hypothetical protein
MTKLYHVTVTYEAVVVASDVFEAERIWKNTHEAGVSEAHVKEISDLHRLPFGWTPNCVPFGGDEETTIRGYLNRLPTAQAPPINVESQTKPNP